MCILIVLLLLSFFKTKLKPLSCNTVNGPLKIGSRILFRVKSEILTFVADYSVFFLSKINLLLLFYFSGSCCACLNANCNLYFVSAVKLSILYKESTFPWKVKLKFGVFFGKDQLKWCVIK